MAKTYIAKTSISIGSQPLKMAGTRFSEDELKKSLHPKTFQNLKDKGVLVPVEEASTSAAKPSNPSSHNEGKRTDGGSEKPQSHDPESLKDLTLPQLSGKIKDEMGKFDNLAAPKIAKIEDAVAWLSANYEKQS